MNDILISMQDGISKRVNEYGVKVAKQTYLVFNWNGQLLSFDEAEDMETMATEARPLPLNANIF